MNHRFWLIELLALWEGRVTTRQLCEQFNISRQQASKDLNAYNLSATTPLIRSTELKGYIAPEPFRFQHISGLVEEYLHWLAEGAMPHTHPHHLTEVLKAPQRQIPPTIMRTLVKASKESLRVEVDYISVSAPCSEGRVIVPHSFIETGSRWHLRAWCEKHGQYRDFVLSRFRGTPELMDSSLHDQTGDLAWNTQVELIFQPDMRLTPEQQQVIA